MHFDAYLFDVQGTLLDFFTPVRDAVARYLTDIDRTDIDAAAVVRAWRADYFRRIASLDQHGEVWHRVQDQYEAGFNAVTTTFGLPHPDPGTARRVAASWQQLVPWPDVPAGLAGIRREALTATLSNTDMSTVIRLAKSLDLRFDAYFTAEVFRRFKPDPKVYLGALAFLDIAP